MTFGSMTRRALLQGGAALSLAGFLPGPLSAQSGAPIKLGSLVPFSGSGGAIGPNIRAAQQAAVDEANSAGGVLGRPVQLIGEDDQTNPEAGVRAARKLIDVDKTITIMGCWSSAVASAIAPLCWENKVMFLCIGAADSITRLPHEGYIVRTQPSTALQSEQFVTFAVGEKTSHLYIMMPQTPFTDSTIRLISETCAKAGVKVSSAIYDAKKTSFRSEVDAMMQAKPDMLMMGGYLPDTVVLAKDVYRANFTGKVVGYAYAIAPAFVEAVGKDVANGMFGIEPMPAVGSKAYDKLKAALKKPEIDIYTCHGYDEVNLALLSVAAAKEASGTAIKDWVRKIGDPQGEKVDNVVDGLKALAAGKSINYLGASGPCKFAPNGDVLSANFRVTKVVDGKIETFKTI